LAGASEISIISPDNGDESLPRIGAGPEDTAEAVEEGAGQPALVRFAVPFQNDSANPMLSIVLVDDPDVPDGPGPADLMDFPVPLAVALDPMQPESAARMAAYRAAGVEVLVLAPLPDGATPADVEVAFQGYLAAIPQAVAVMDLPSAQLQANRPRAVQVVEILAASGHGMVTYDKGLNAGLQIAEGRGVPARAVFRVFDDGSRDTGAMKRSLDQGAFRAGQAGPVVLVGKLRAESIAAITEWALGTRAATVSLAPVSAVLQAK
jgi:polysaccharide deacetylase 2 family uncharacterized protein YibQ